MAALRAPRVLSGQLWLLAGVLMLALMVAVDISLGRQINGAYAGAAVLVAINADVRRTSAIAFLVLVASFASGTWNDNLGERDWAIRFVSCALICGLAVWGALVNQRQRQRAARMTHLAARILDALAVELTGARTTKDVAEGFVGHAVTTLGATSAMVFTLDDDQVLRILTRHGQLSEGANQYQEIPLDSDNLIAVAARDRTDLHFRALAEIAAAFPDLAGHFPVSRRLHLLPLQRDGTTHGLLGITFPAGLFTASEDGFLHSLASALTSAALRARELTESDAAAQRTALLAEASMTLSRSLDLDETLAEVVRLLVPRFSDWCSLRVVRDGGLETVLVEHRDADVTKWAHSMRDAFPTRVDSPTGAPNVIRTGQSEIYPFIPADMLEASATSHEHLTVLRRLGLTSAIIAPLTGREGVFGALTLIHAESGRRYTNDDLDFLVAMADRVALALDAASSYEEQSERLAGVTLVAEAAQRAILAPPPGRNGPVALSACYVSAAEEAHVGGDLYEVVRGPSRVRLLVGDVRGKGLAAVRTATVVLGEFRAAAAGSGDVAQVAREIDRRIVPYLPDPEDFVTAVLVDIEDDGRFSVASCGHPSPVLLTNSGDVDELELDHAPPLGLGVNPVTTYGQLSPGDRLLLYTDGLIEARLPRGGFIDHLPLLPFVAQAEFPDALDGLLASLRQLAGSALGDDLALLLACYDPMVEGVTSARTPVTAGC